MLESLPALAQRVTVLGSTRNSAATSAGVSSASGAGADWTVRLADMVATPHLETSPRRDGILAEVLNILEASNGTDHSNLGLFSAPPSRTIGNRPPELGKGCGDLNCWIPYPAEPTSARSTCGTTRWNDPGRPLPARPAPPRPPRPNGRPPGPRTGLLWLVLRSRAGPGCRDRSCGATPAAPPRPRPSRCRPSAPGGCRPRGAPGGAGAPAAALAHGRPVGQPGHLPRRRRPDPPLAVLEQGEPGQGDMP